MIIRRRRTDKRSFAFETVPDPIQPAVFQIKIMDDKKNAISEFTFDISIDNETDKVMQTDENGIIMIKKPTIGFNLSIS
jgi:hypothetical protein